ncbi:glycosyltransferase family 4 protein [Peribacillus simplex]|uniref:Group 1 glycosyl transferase n=1 Tax=Peribacillus simplex TaxID=1478 RepID=A0AAN2PJF8_9BACI|nr:MULTISPECIES: glycosyltransferase family 4 protein [Bacillaceae]MCP1097293.1 glycosyltransferase family 4 protein [Bacillaceae bacterium OS4b]MBD8590156.1 glycosyltransferase family 4 protein [Peribacillus simplex]MCF7622678.1 glycosyltransferase family 4 protein [Peribacillus frigoritolerans]MCP1153222.1 glycosyltransferase family 4 protein [Peribacillus frigoritolerans]MCT1390821.1 glycosyltransferase family 4 protein [Peribacillus frigoritolerans]
MKIALICTEMFTVPPIGGGAIQVLIDGVTPHLSKEHDLTIYCITHPDFPDREVVNSVEYIRVPRENYVFNVGKELSKKHANKEYYDVVHVFNRPRDLLIYKTAMPESRFVLSLHNEMFKEGKISTEMGNLVIKAVDKIMTISEYIGKTITSRFPSAKRKVKAVYSGINLNRYKPVWDKEVQSLRSELRQKYGVDDKKVILFVGRLSAVKGPDILIKAMKQVIKKHNDSVLVIVGSKWFSDDRIDDFGLSLRQLAESLGKDKVIFTGFVPPSEIPSQFLIGDIFVCSSQWQEPLARVHYEAMGTGLPIITTNRGGNAEIMKHLNNGIVIEDYTNPEAFADAISFLLSNEQEADILAKAGRAFVETNFGFEHVAKRLENLYLASIKRNKP